MSLSRTNGHTLAYRSRQLHRARGLPIPATAEFELVAVDDPYHFASSSELSLFRRPLPTANLEFDSTVMWDGREVVPGATVASELATQANDATMGHAQGRATTQAQRESIVRFETELATAQILDRAAQDLRSAGARGGPDNGSAPDLSTAVEFYDTRFNVGLSAQDKSDLAAFLRSL